MRILIVEDEARIRAFVARAFEAEGFGVDVVADGEQCLARALTGQYDRVILDLLLPGCSGLDRCARSTASGPSSQCSSCRRAATSRSSCGVSSRAVDYVAKPFSLDELLARARVPLRRARVADGGTEIRVGSLVLDLRAARRASATSRPIFPTASSGCSISC